MVSARPLAELVNDVEGVEVAKSLKDEEYDLPSIEYKLDSNRDEPVTITIRDPVPNPISIENVGFHREYGKDYWEIEDDELVFEYTLEAGENLKAVYAFRTGKVEVTDDLMLPPNSVDVSPSKSNVPEPQEMTRSAAESPYSDGQGMSPGDTEGDEDIETDDDDVVDAISEVESIELESEDPCLVDRLARELENEEPSPESLETLQEHFIELSSSTGSTDARVSQLQEDVSKLRAYTNALEEFLEEEGAAQEIVQKFERRMDGMEAELESLQSSTEVLEETVESVESEISDVERSVGSVENDLEEYAAEVDSLRDDLNSLDEQMPRYSIDERFADVEDELDSVREFVENLKTAFE